MIRKRKLAIVVAGVLLLAGVTFGLSVNNRDGLKSSVVENRRGGNSEIYAWYSNEQWTCDGTTVSRPVSCISVKTGKVFPDVQCTNANPTNEKPVSSFSPFSGEEGAPTTCEQVLSSLHRQRTYSAFKEDVCTSYPEVCRALDKGNKKQPLYFSNARKSSDVGVVTTKKGLHVFEYSGSILGTQDAGMVLNSLSYEISNYNPDTLKIGNIKLYDSITTVDSLNQFNCVQEYQKNAKKLLITCSLVQPKKTVFTVKDSRGYVPLYLLFDILNSETSNQVMQFKFTGGVYNGNQTKWNNQTYPIQFSTYNETDYCGLYPETCVVAPIETTYKGTSWDCYDGTVGESLVCQTLTASRVEAEMMCKGHCSKTSGKCGVNGMLTGTTCEIQNPSITILSPNGGGYYNNDGSPININWSTKNVPSDFTFDVIRLRGYPNGGEVILSQNVINDGSDVISFKGVPAGAYTLEMKAYLNGVLVMDSSDSYFKITATSSIETTYKGTSWDCYDGTVGESLVCQTLTASRVEAEMMCKGHCSKTSGKCGVNSFMTGQECLLISLTPKCGTAITSIYSIAPTDNLCTSGTVTMPVKFDPTTTGSNGNGMWMWRCGVAGSSVGETCGAMSSAPKCGTATNNTFFTAPTNDLCAAGTVVYGVKFDPTTTGSNGNGMWMWRCGVAGSSKGETCGAQSTVTSVTTCPNYSLPVCREGEEIVSGGVGANGCPLHAVCRAIL